MVNTHDRLTTLYTEDFVAWVDETTRLLKEGAIDSLDWPHLIEEIEGLGSEQRNKVDSYLLQLLIHLLLYQYWGSEREYSGRGWSIEIANFRVQLETLFESRTLYNYYLSRIENAYAKAVKLAVKKSDLPRSHFPETCPFTADEILDDDFLPSIAR
jgi:hypothetical protein